MPTDLFATDPRMLDIVLYQPEIPPNAGNVIRLAANTGARLHFVRPLGFAMTNRALARAGMDYCEFADVVLHADWPACRAALADKRLFAVTTRGTQRHDQIKFAAGDVLVFGPESSGLPGEVLDEFPPAQRLRVPMLTVARSLNLANAVAVVVYEAWRQLGFRGSR